MTTPSSSELVVVDPTANMIVPPPSILNPIPSLSVALRYDNYEQLVSLLSTHPTKNNAITTDFRQLLVFGNTSLRTVLLRQVLNDPHTRTTFSSGTSSTSTSSTSSTSSSNKKHNWDKWNSFPLPKTLQTNIVGTKLLLSPTMDEKNGRDGRNPQDAHYYYNNKSNNKTRTAGNKNKSGQKKKMMMKSTGSTAAAAADDDDDDVFTSPEDLFQHVDVITYFLRPWDLTQTMAVIGRVKACTVGVGVSVNTSSSTTNTTSTSTTTQGTTTTTTITGNEVVTSNLLSGGLSAVLGGGGGGGKIGSGSTTPHHHNNTVNHLAHIHHRIVYVPQITALCQQVLADSGILSVLTNTVSIQSLQLDVFPIETDLYSMEYDHAIYEMLVEGTPSPLIGTCARALLKVQDVVGTIPKIQSLGRLGEDVLAKVLNAKVDEYLLDGERGTGSGTAGTGMAGKSSVVKSLDDNEPNPQPIPDDTGMCMVLIDRRLDMVTPMVTPLTYEGLLDEVVGIDVGFIHVPEGVINPPEDDDQKDDTNKKRDNDKQKQQKTNKKEMMKKKSTSNPFDDDDNDVDGAHNDGNDGDDDGIDNDDGPIVALGVHAGDTLFAEVRDQHVEKFGSFLQNQAVALKESHANFTSKGTKKDLNEIHQFVKQIPIFTQSLRSLTNHIHLAERIKATTEDVTFRERWNTERAMIEGETCYDLLENEYLFAGMNHCPYKVLRLLCLQSLTGGGLKANRYDQFKQYFVQVYGYDFLPILHDLEFKLGWIKRKDTLFMDSHRAPFQSIRKNLILIHAEVDTVEPDDVSYVSSGYAPLTVRLVQAAIQGWKDKEEVLKDLFGTGSGGGSSGGGGSANPGRLLDVQQMYPPQDLPSTLKNLPTHNNNVIGEPLGVYAKRRMGTSSTHGVGGGGGGGGGGGRKKPTLIVVYLGGITHMEIAALRFLSKRDTFPFHIIIVTTKVMNGTKLIRQLG